MITTIYNKSGGNNMEIHQICLRCFFSDYFWKFFSTWMFDSGCIPIWDAHSTDRSSTPFYKGFSVLSHVWKNFSCILYTLLPIQLPVNPHPGRQSMMTQVLESLQCTWETQVKFYTPCFGLVQSWLFQKFAVNQQMKGIHSFAFRYSEKKFF